MEVACKREAERLEASAVMQRLSYPTETVLSNEITRDRIVLSFKDSPRKPLGQRPKDSNTCLVLSDVSPMLQLEPSRTKSSQVVFMKWH